MEALPVLRGATPIGQIGRFELLGKLAQGGMAEIFLAREVGPAAAARTLVVKRILPHVADNPQFREMFAQEARLSMQLRHPNICPIYEFGEHGGTFFLAMEWVNGASLRDLLDRARTRPLPVPIVLQLGADVAAALHSAHTSTDADGRPLGIVHRDVTPENILIGYDGSVKLVDFGVAKAATQLQKTKTGVLKGKLPYMSPEHYQGGTIDGRSDVFSLGVCLFECLTGVNPFERTSEYETIAAIVLETEVPSPRGRRPDLAPAVDAIVGRALQKRPDDRFESADALQRALEELLASEQRVVRASDISAVMRDFFAADMRMGPRLDTTPLKILTTVGEPRQRLSSVERYLIAADVDDAEEQMASLQRRRRLFLRVMLSLLVIGAIVATVLAIREKPPAPVIDSGAPSEAPR